MTLTRFRESVVNEIPKNLKIAISAGIGVFIAFIGFTGSKIIVQDPNTFITLGNLRETTVLLSILGFTLMIVLQAYRVREVILWGIIAVAVLGIVLGIIEIPDRLISMPLLLFPSLSSLIFSLLTNPDFYVIMFTFLFTDFFDTVGTLVGVSSRADFLDEEGKLPKAKQALMADAIATCAGAVLGTSTVTTYVESASGVEEGGRTGLTAVVVAGLFLLAILISPIAAVIPGYATSPALIMVGIIMIQSLRDLDFDTWTEVVPVVVTILMMTFSYSIAEGIVWGIISYTVIKVGSEKFKDISLIMVF